MDTLTQAEDTLKTRYRCFSLSWYVKDAEQLQLEAHVHPDGTREVNFILSGSGDLRTHEFGSNAELAEWCEANDVPFSSCQYLLHLLNLAMPSFLGRKGDL